MHNSTSRLSYDIAQLCLAHGIQTLIVSPGSRNAPLAMAFQQVPDMQCLSMVDERSAAFFAMGMTQAKKQGIAICCTSGSALLNYYPAVAEAFYQELPLLIISADRPLEKIDQQIGQSIRQAHVFSNHIKESVQLVEANGDKSLIAYNQRRINEALIALNTAPYGPVHINVPLREPLYEAIGPFSEKPKLIRSSPSELHLSDGVWEELLTEWQGYSKILVLAGMNSPDPSLSLAVEQVSQDSSVVVLADWVSGLSGEHIHCEIDKILNHIVPEQEEYFSPDLVISYGNGLVSKRIKHLVSNWAPRAHWFVHPQGKVIDTYECLSRVIRAHPVDFFSELGKRILPKHSNYRKYWKLAYQSAQRRHTTFLASTPFSDLKAFDIIHSHLPQGWALHLANSSVIRYMQMFPKPAKLLSCFGNRGTSGIDGATSTAIGHAFGSEYPNLLISGDVSFFYDSNAWWNAYIAPQFRAIILNNGGGGIFRLIDGPEKGGVLEKFQETPHSLSAEKLAETHGIEYHKADNEVKLKNVLLDFFHTSESAKILEVFTPRFQNADVWEAYLENLRHRFKMDAI